MPQRPNILFLMSDEHRADVVGHEGNPVIRTPVLDELARTGVAFRNAYTPSPVCVPCRQCMMAGQLPRTCHADQYGGDLTPGYLTWPRLLSRYAYVTIACGKLHYLGSDQMQGFVQRIGMDDQITWGYIDGRLEEELEKYLPRPASRDEIHDRKWTDGKEIRRAGVGRSPYSVWDDYAVEGAELFIRQYFVSPFYDREQSHRPLLLYLGLNSPHYPYLADQERFEYYLNRVEPYLDEEPFPHPWLGKSAFMPGPMRIGPEGEVSERDARRATAAYYANIEANEHRYGRVIDALERAGQDLDDWIVVYATDHGEMLGQHAVWEKQKFFEGSARVPLIIRWPSRFAGGRVVTQNVNLCDLYATICDLTGIPAPEDLDSRSLVPLLEGREANWDNETISHFGTENLMIKRDALKYQYYGEDMPEVLFDLDKDPTESHSLIGDPTYTGAVAAFRKRRSELGYGPDANPDYRNAGY
jgi:choline-sulfatase